MLNVLLIPRILESDFVHSEELFPPSTEMSNLNKETVHKLNIVAFYQYEHYFKVCYTFTVIDVICCSKY